MYNLHTIQFYHSKYIVWWFLVNLYSCSTITIIYSENISITPKCSLMSISSQSQHSFQPCSLFLEISYQHLPYVVFAAGFFHSAKWFGDLSRLLKVSLVSPFLLLSSIPLFGSSSLCLHLNGFQCLPTWLTLLWTFKYKSLCVNIWFHFSLVDPKERSCWVLGFVSV